MIDSHTHLDFADFKQDLANVITQSLENGIQKMVVVGVKAKNWQRIFNLAQNYSCLSTAYGIHPWYCEDLPQNITDYLQTTKCCAVGEIGLDYTCQQSRKFQQQIFVTQLKLAKQLNLPVILHVIKSHADVIFLLKQYKLARAGIVHAFNGSFEQAKEYIKLGFCLGFGGVATYPKATKLQQTLAKLPLQNIVLETDSPFLSPVFASKIRNNPANLAKICIILAKICGISAENLAKITTQNCIRILQL